MNNELSYDPSKAGIYRWKFWDDYGIESIVEATADEYGAVRMSIELLKNFLESAGGDLYEFIPAARLKE